MKPKFIYNSHGNWSTLGEIRATERERGNYFPRLGYPKDTPTIWGCLTRRKALRYGVAAEDWERIDDETQPLTDQEKEWSNNLAEIELEPNDLIAHDDGDEGYLIVRVDRDFLPRLNVVGFQQRSFIGHEHLLRV